MRGKLAKKIRRAVYGDLSLKSREYRQITRKARLRPGQKMKRGIVMAIASDRSRPATPAVSAL